MRDATSKKVYAVHLCTENSTIAEVPLREKHSDNLTSPFESFPANETLPQQPLVHTVFRHHAFIASDGDIIILNLKAEEAVFERLEVGHHPREVFVYQINEEQYSFVSYVNEDGNEFIKRFRRFSNHQWGQYGQPVQMTSEAWFDLDTLSNTIIFKADDLYFGSPAVYAALASQWYIFVCNMFDGTYFTLEAPLPCYGITQLNYNQAKQTMFVECKEGMSYMDFKTQQYFQPTIWRDTVGETHFTSDGQFAAVVYTTGNVSTVVIVDLNVTTGSYEYGTTESIFPHFNLTTEDGCIMNGEFVTVSDTQHYFCFVKDVEDGIQCLDVEGGFRTDAIIQSQTLPNSEGVCVTKEDCTMYVHHCVVVAKRCMCEGLECEIVNLVFDLSTFQNKWNVTGIETDFQTFRPIKQNNSVAMETPTTDAVTMPTTEAETTPTTEAVTTTTNAETTPTTETITTPTTETPTTAEAVTIATTARKATPTSPHEATPTEHHATPTHHVTRLEACKTALENVNEAYDELHRFTIGYSVVISVIQAVVWTVVLVMCCKGKCLSFDSTFGYTHANGGEKENVMPQGRIPMAAIGDGTKTAKNPGKITHV